MNINKYVTLNLCPYKHPLQIDFSIAVKFPACYSYRQGVALSLLEIVYVCNIPGLSQSPMTSTYLYCILVPQEKICFY